jgi:hypothetical protein
MACENFLWGAPRIHGELLTADTVVADIYSRDGTVVPGRTEIVEDAARKRAIVTAHPFVPLAPFRIVRTLALDVFAPVTTGMLRRWVIARPIVAIHV